MAKIQKSTKQALNEGANDIYTLDQLLGKTYRGDKVTLVNNFLNKGLNRWAKSLGKKAANVRLDQARLKGSEWVNIFRYGGVPSNLAQQIEATVNAKSVQQGVADAMTKGGELTPAGGNHVNANGEYSSTVQPQNFTQLLNALQGDMQSRGGSTSMFFRNLFEPSGVLRNSDPNAIKKMITDQMRRAEPTITQTNPQAWPTIQNVLTQWMNGQNQAIKYSEVISAMNQLGKVLNTSRNDMPIVRGFQVMMSKFGTPLKPDGIIGQQTRAALQQAGYKDIFAFKSDVQAVQTALGVQPDGIIGKNTLVALQQNGITSLQAFKSVANSASAPTGPTQIANAQTPGITLEAKKIKITESELKQIIKESVEEIMFGDAGKKANQNIAGQKPATSPKKTAEKVKQPTQTQQPQQKKPSLISKGKKWIQAARDADNQVNRTMTPQERIGYENIMNKF